LSKLGAGIRGHLMLTVRQERRLRGRLFTRKLFACKEDYIWPTRGITEDMRGMDEGRLSAIIGYIELNDRSYGKMIESKQYAWAKAQLGLSWGWMRMVKRRRYWYEAVESLSEQVETERRG